MLLRPVAAKVSGRLRATRSGSRKPWCGRWRERRPPSLCAANGRSHIEFIEAWRWRDRWFDVRPSWSHLFRNESSNKKPFDPAPERSVLVNVSLTGKAPWVITSSEQSPALEIVLFKQAVILSWSQFVYAEGGGDELRIAFASHDVVVKGTGLDPLLAAIASHRVASIHESERSERFLSPAARFIREIVVRKIDVD
jgi:hypothetical protein